MKNKIVFGLVLPLVIAASLIACKKNFFDTPPLGSVGPEQLYNKAGVNKILIGVYSLLDEVGYDNPYATDWKSQVDNWINGDIVSDDAYKGGGDADQRDINPFESYTVTPQNPFLEPKFLALYDGASRANDVLRATAQATDMSEEEKTVVVAQARGLRGHYYLELKKIWNRIPFVDETAPDFKLPNDKDIWPDIENDFKYASDNLPETFPEVGRMNKWAAKCYLAKTYMFQKKYAEAKAILDDVLANGKTTNGLKYGLEACFRNAFDGATENGKESVFAVQMSLNDGAENAYNGAWFWALNDRSFFRPSQNLVNAYKTDAAGLPLLDTWNNSDVNSDQGLPSSSPFTPYTGTLDPRLDWTVGRRGIPFLGYGVHPGQDWNYGSDYGGPYNSVKFTATNDQQGTLTQSDVWASAVSAYNYPFIRFSDVLLWAAECEVEVGTVDKARDLVNIVRLRAKNSCTVEAIGGGPAANYLVNTYSTTWSDQALGRKAVRFERRLELALEGHRFYDLVRWGVAADVLNTYTAKEKLRQTYLVGAQFVAGKNEYMPIPDVEITNSFVNGAATLKQNPGY